LQIRQRSFIMPCIESALPALSLRAYCLGALMVFMTAVRNDGIDAAVSAGCWGRLAVCHRYFNLPKQTHNLSRRMLLSSCHSWLLSYQFVSLKLVQKAPGSPRASTLIFRVRQDKSTARLLDFLQKPGS
jgi:hypothetical protein